MTRQRFRLFLLQQGNINVDSGDDMEGGARGGSAAVASRKTLASMSMKVI